MIRLRHICKRAIAHGYINISPAEHISNKPKLANVKKMDTLSKDEIRLLLDTCDDFWRPLFIVWLATGMRRAEIFGLDPSCIDDLNNRIHVHQQLKDGKIVSCTKNRKPRAIDVAPEIISVVKHHLAEFPYVEGTEKVVFPSVTGKPVHVSDWYRDVFKPLVTKIGRPEIGTQALRHTYASQALSIGMNIKVLQQMLGHADASLTLNRYSHLVPSDSRTPAAAMAGLLLSDTSVTTDSHLSSVPDESTEVA